MRNMGMRNMGNMHGELSGGEDVFSLSSGGSQIEALRRAIADGTYRVDARSVAGSILTTFGGPGNGAMWPAPFSPQAHEGGRGRAEGQSGRLGLGA